MFSRLINQFRGHLQNPKLHFWLVFGIFLLLSLLAIRGVLFSAGPIGFRHDWSIPETAGQLQNWVKQAFYPWVEARGGYNVPYWSDIVLRFTLGWLSFAGMGGDIFSKLIIILGLTLSGLTSCYFFKKFFTRRFPVALLAAFFYTFNPLVFNKIISGHTYYLLAFALAPLFLGLALTALDNRVKSCRFWFFALAAALVFSFAVIQMQFPILLSIALMVLVFIFQKSWSRFLVLFPIVGATSLIIHLPWLYSVVVGTIINNVSTSNSPSTLAWFSHNSSQVLAAFFALGGGNDYFTDSLLADKIFFIWLVPAVLLLALVIYRLTRQPGRRYLLTFGFFLLVVAALSVNRIWPELAWFLIQKSIIFNLFREVYHATFFVTLFFSILLINVLNYWLAANRSRLIKYILLISVIAFSLPFFVDGKLLNNLQTRAQNYDYQAEINAGSGANENENADNRLLFLPNLQPLGVDGLQYSGFNPAIYFQDNGAISQMGYYGSLSERFATFLNSQFYFDSADFAAVLPQYLQMLDVKNIVFQPEYYSDLVPFTYLNQFPAKVAQLSNDTLSKVLAPYSSFAIGQADDYSVYQFDDSQKISGAEHCLATGGWDNLDQIFALKGSANCQAVFFAKDRFYRDLPADTPVIFNNNNWPDLLLKDPANHVIESGMFANQGSDPFLNWVAADQIWWYEPEIAGHSKIITFSQAQGAQLNIDLSSLRDNENYYLFIEYFQHPQGGDLELSYQDWTIKYNSFSQNKNFVWQQYGPISINSASSLEIINLEGANAIGQIMFVPAVDLRNQLDSVSVFLENHPKVILNNPAATASSAFLPFDFNNSNAQFYQNFPEFSRYQFIPSPTSLIVDASFSGDLEQDEFASIIYPAGIDLLLTPIIEVSATVENQDVQFWEIGLEVDIDGDKNPDNVIWTRLKPGRNLLDALELVFGQINLDEDQLYLVNLRLQPHKEYAVDMADFATKDYRFVVSDLSFYASAGELVRLPRLSGQFDLDKLKTDPAVSLSLDQGVDFYNDFPATAQQLIADPSHITINSQFTDSNEGEFAKVVLNTMVNIVDHPYFTVDLKVDDHDLQFYDLAFGVDSDFDQQIDRLLWVDPIIFNNNQSQTVFFDVLDLLKQDVNDYDRPRVLTIEILAHRAYKIDGTPPAVSFDIRQAGFYHEANLHQAQLQPLPAFHNQLNAPQTGTYELYLNINSAAADQIAIVVDSQNLELEVPASLDHQWLKVGLVNLEQGDNDIILFTNQRDFKINTLALFKDFPLKLSPQAIVSNFIHHSPTYYSADVVFDKPGYLLFKEGFHPAWQLQATTEQESFTLSPQLVNGWEQGYYFDRAGQYHIEINYTLTNHYHLALAISAVFLGLTITALLWLKFIGTNHENKLEQKVIK